VKRKKEFRRLFSEWTPEQEKFAEKFVSYILIQTKNKWDKGQVDDILRQCIPMTNPEATSGPVKPFEQHTTKNPYLSILMDFGWTPKRDQPSVEFVPAATLRRCLGVCFEFVSFCLRQRGF
jgi:hypothetical protein